MDIFELLQRVQEECDASNNPSPARLALHNRCGEIMTYLRYPPHKWARYFYTGKEERDGGEVRQIRDESFQELAAQVGIPDDTRRQIDEFMCQF